VYFGLAGKLPGGNSTVNRAMPSASALRRSAGLVGPRRSISRSRSRPRVTRRALATGVCPLVATSGFALLRERMRPPGITSRGLRRRRGLRGWRGRSGRLHGGLRFRRHQRNAAEHAQVGNPAGFAQAWARGGTEHEVSHAELQAEDRLEWARFTPQKLRAGVF